VNVDVNGWSEVATGPYGLVLTGAQARLYTAAVEAFASKGFHGTTTRDIAAGAGMSPAALYVHHRSKEEVLHLISSAGHAQTLAIVREAVESSSDPVLALGRLVGAFVQHHAVNHTVARVVNYELTSLSPEHHAEVLAMRAEMDAQVRGLIERGVARGVFSTPSPAMTAAAVLSLGVDVARWYDTRGGWSPADLAEHYRVLVLRMVGIV
jgi:AcrR family transcriptional regulator